MAWATDLRDEEIDEAWDDYAQEGYERGVNMDDGRDPEEQ